MDTPSDTPFNAIKIFISSSRVIIERMKKIEDPVIKYSSFIQLLRVLFDVSNNVTIESIHNNIDNTHDKLEEILNESTKNAKENDKSIINTIRDLNRKLKKLEDSEKEQINLYKLMNEYLDGFENWISQPLYSPDHPSGKEVMSAAKDHLTSLSSQV